MALSEKTCSKCGLTKPRSAFGERSDRKPGALRPQCLQCERERSAAYKAANAEAVAASNTRRKLERPNAGKEAQARYRAAHPEARVRDEQRRRERRDEVNERARELYAAGRSKVTARKRAWRERNHDAALKIERASKARVDPSLRKLRNKEQNGRRRATPEGRLHNTLRARIHREVVGKTTKAGRHTFDLLGYTPEVLRVHLERQFSPGMSWANYGMNGWHIDHRVPLSAFHYDSVDHPAFKAAWALTNLQPMWASENFSKGARRLLLI